MEPSSERNQTGFSLQVDPETAEALRDLAAVRGRSLAEVLREAVANEAHLTRPRWSEEDIAGPELPRATRQSDVPPGDADD